ncbi:hypothetical protein [Deinococcus pimensis]|uniref:hypothetical protein n=1 Tax=Deinococcus pimensis TaxID=309888 RepID=UPI000485AEC6|nr:hypothetical protein [Deinococcus pimensis]
MTAPPQLNEDLPLLQLALTQRDIPWHPRDPWPHGKHQATHAASVSLVTAFITHVPPDTDWKLTLQTLVGAYLAWPDLQTRALALLAARFSTSATNDPGTDALKSFLRDTGQPWRRRTQPAQVRQLLHPISAALSRALKASCEARFPQALKDLYVTLVALYCLDPDLRGRVDAAVKARTTQ